MGELAIQNLEHLSCDLAFISTSAIQTDGVLYAPKEERGVLKRQMIRKSETAVLVADSSKYEESGLYRVAELKDFDIVISNIPWSADLKAQMAENRIRMIQVLA